jgi:hypothetical protein
MNDEQTQQPSYSLPYAVEGASMQTVELKLKTEDIIREIKNALLGRIVFGRDGNGNDIYAQEGEPLMSAEGVGEVMTIVRSYFHRGFILGNFDDRDIEILMTTFHIKLALHLGSCTEKLKLTNKSNLHIITDIVTNNIWASLKRSLFSLEQNHMTKSQHYQETRVFQDQPKKGVLGIFGRGEK